MEVYPKADAKLCMTHKMRNTTAVVRQKDRPAIMADLKKVYSLLPMILPCNNWSQKRQRCLMEFAEAKAELIRMFEAP